MAGFRNTCSGRSPGVDRPAGPRIAGHGARADGSGPDYAGRAGEPVAGPRAAGGEHLRLLRRHRAAAGVYWRLRHAGVQRNAPHRGNRHPHDTGSAAGRGVVDGAARGPAFSFGRRRGWCAGCARSNEVGWQLAVRTPAGRPDDDRNFGCGYASRSDFGGLPACAARGIARPYEGAPVRVGRAMVATIQKR